MSILQNSNAISAPAGGSDFYEHQIANSARFTSSGVLTRTAGTATNEDKFTISCWIKRSKLGANQNFIFGDQSNIHYQRLSFNSSDKLEMHEQRGGGDSNGVRTISQVFRDTSAWQHIVWTYDTAQGTDTNREKFYVNGSQLTDVEGWDGDYPAQNRDSVFNKNGSTLKIGGASSYYGNYFQGYMAEVVFCDGQAYAASDFGEFKNGVWKPVDPSGLTFGNNGFYLNFASSGDMGNDVSGNNNDFTESNVDTHDQMTDSPTFNSDSNGGNFCIMNPLNSGSNNTFSEGNLKVTNSSGGCTALGTMSLVTGHKWYFEGKCTGSGNNWIGIIEENGYTNSANTNSSIAGSGSFNTYLYGYNGLIYYGSSSTSTGASFGSGDIMGVLVDLESGTNTIQFYKNGSAQGSAFNLTGTGINYTPMSDRGSGSGDGFWFNFGQEGTFGTGSGGGNSDATGYGSFYYDDGAAAKAICTGNLPTADAVDPAQTDDNFPSQLFDAQLWTGNGSSGRAITISGAKKPSLSVIKQRNSSNAWNVWTQGYNSGDYDSFGEFNSNAAWYANQGASGPYTADPTASALTLSAYGQVNASSQTYVNYRWVANGGTTSTNSTGSLNVTQEVDPSGGFSISTYSGDGGTDTIGHGLSSAATFVMIKQTNGANNWAVYAKGAGNTKYAYLDGTGAFGTAAMWNNTTPSSSLVYLGDNNEVNASGRTYVAFCFADTEGYIKSGYFEGNGNTNGPFVYTGFRPSLVMRKRSDGSGSWLVKDDARNPVNDASIEVLTWNDPQAENAQSETSDGIDFLSNGFKLKATNNGSNGNGLDYIYLAISFNPFKYSTAF